MAPVRLFGRLHLQRRNGRRVQSIRLRVHSPVPVGATVYISDVQLQPGRAVTGWTLHSSDLGVQPATGWQFRNGVVYGDQTLVVVADAPAASPMRWEITRANGPATIGAYQMGDVTSGWVDGAQHRATQGAGIPPHLTARSDVDVPVKLTGRALLSCWFRGLAVAEPLDALPDDPDPFDPDAPVPDPSPEPEPEPPVEPPLDP